MKLALRYFIGKAFTGWQNMVCEIKWHEGMLKKAAMKRSNLRLSRIFASWFDEHCTEGEPCVDCLEYFVYLLW